MERGIKRTLDQVAKDLGMSRGQLDRAKKEGLNPYDTFAMKEWKDGRREKAPNGDSALPPEELPETGERLTVEQIEEMASRPNLTKKHIEVYKGQLDVMKAATALRVQQGKLISKEEVDERDAAIAHALNAMLRRFEKEFPNLALGLPLHESAPLIKSQCQQMQAMLADKFSEFWETREAE